ncbi:hypothetical protein GP486_003668 [Trichoglossum hirsutum]|uniref:PPPDE domain-containing protein n=1 Tax=Trichoglossum hirsutum TaxID=265104 RepID=A0A9P8LCL7_9PEZI|nr:hypothetical protein GP486_003668 [Trichoglossum hirsutum]
MASHGKKTGRKPSATNHRSTLSLQKTEVLINVYDLLPASEEFLGTSYNLLTLNCNHFTSHLCRALTSRHAPAWLNRAASIGLALPCVVPQEWIAPPDADTADGALLDDGDEFHDDERTMMLRNTRDRMGNRHSLDEDSFIDDREDQHPSEDSGKRRQHVEDNVAAESSGRGRVLQRDTSGRPIPTSEVAPTPMIR